MVSRLKHLVTGRSGHDARPFTVFVAQHADAAGGVPARGLSGRGREQAAAFASSMKRGDIDIFVTGPEQASVETAAAMQSAIGGELIVLEEFGGSTTSRADERLQASAERFLKGLDVIRERFSPSQRVMVISEGERTLAAVRSMRSDAQIETAAPGTIEDGIPSCALTTFVWRAGAWDVEMIAALTIPDI